MTRIEATKFLIDHPEFQDVRVQEYLKEQLERREAGIPLNPRGYIVTAEQIRAAIKTST
jgi:hypothetical protein